MSDFWSYEKQKRFDSKGRRWHFVRRYFFSNNAPFELYFRNDARTEFGVLRFENAKDNPYRNYEVIVNKLMNNEEFRKTLLAPETEKIWSKNWK